MFNFSLLKNLLFVTSSRLPKFGKLGKSKKRKIWLKPLLRNELQNPDLKVRAIEEKILIAPPFMAGIKK